MTHTSSAAKGSIFPTSARLKSLSQWRYQPFQSKREARHVLVISLLTGLTIAICGTAVASYRVVYGIVLEDLKQQTLMKAKQGSAEIDQWLTACKTEVETLANTPTVRSLNWSVAEPYLRSEQRRVPDFYFFTLAYRDGSTSNTIQGQQGINHRDREWFIKAMARQTTIANPVKSRVTGVVQINIAAPILSLDQTRPIGALSGGIKINRVVQVINRLQNTIDSYAFVLNSNGVPIAHPNAAMIGTPEHPAPSFLQSENPQLGAIARHMLNKEHGVELASIDGKSVYVAYTPLKQVDWSLALVIPQHVIDMQLGSLNLLAVVLAILLLIAIVGAWRQVQLFEDTRTRAAQSTLLNRLTNRIRESLELQTIVETTVTEMATLLQLNRVIFGWHNQVDQTFEVVCDFSDQVVYRGVTFHVDAELDLAAALLDGQAIECQACAPGLESDPLQLAAHSYSALFIAEHNDCSGYLIGLPSHPLNAEDQKVLRDVADQLAIAITQAFLYIQTRAQVELLNQTLTTLKKTQLQLVQSEKMSSLGQLIAGIAHEINNPVNFIYGNLSYVNQYSQELLKLIETYEEDYPQPTNRIQKEASEVDLEFIREDLPKLLTSMEVGAHRIREIVKSLRNFSRLDEAEVKDVDIHAGLDSTLMILQNRIKVKPEYQGIEVVKHYGELPPIECYAGQLNQVFMNILSNAIDALEEICLIDSLELAGNTNPTPCASRQGTIPTITIHTQIVDRQQVQIRIADNGAGMSETVRQRIFDPFFTTKPVGKGTGMGLAISYQIVTERHKGRLCCNSTLGQGTEFVIEIPIYQSSPS